MGKKLQWFKMYSSDWLSDYNVRSLPDGARALLHDLNCIMRTQTIRPGILEMKGEEGQWNYHDEATFKASLRRLAKRYSMDSRRVHRWFTTVIISGILEVSPEGLVYWDRIVKEYEESEVKSLAGKRSVQQRVQHGVQLEEKREEKKRGSCSTELGQGSGPSYRQGIPLSQLAEEGSISGTSVNEAEAEASNDPHG